MNKLLQTFAKIAFIILLLVFAIAFFLYKQYWLAFFTLGLILIFSRWDQVKKIIIGKEKIEVQIPENMIKKEEEKTEN